jgi:DNA ligase (NAD+)
MDKQEAKVRIEALKKEIDANRYAYHVLDEPRVSDAIDDSLKHELFKLEEEFPEFKTADSPTQRVGGKALDKFVKVTHKIPMLSLNDVFSSVEFTDWEARISRLVKDSEIKDSGFYCEVKMDGLAVNLVYKDGIFISGATRGDGKVGEDVTNNLKTIESIPLKLKNYERYNHGDLEIRGEVYIDLKDFDKINVEQKKKNSQIFANPRNLAAGSIRQLDPSIAASRKLKFMMYSVVTDLGLKYHSDEHRVAEELGFNGNFKISKIASSSEEVVKFYNSLEEKRSGLPYQIDGVVVGINDKKIFAKLGVVGKAPRGQIAFKFPAEEATSILKDIIVQVGRTGKLTPVAILEPTIVAGSTVSRATLHNEEEIQRKGIMIGDTVVIRKAGDVIPEVVEPIKNLRPKNAKEFQMPQTCPICGGSVIKRAGEVDHYCADKNCSTRVLRQLNHFVSKGAFEIDGMGPKIMQQLVNVGLVRDASDIFDLKVGDLEPLERFAEKSAQNLIESISAARDIDLDRFIYSLGIRHVGDQMATDIARQFATLENFRKLHKEELDKMYGIGDKVAESVIEFLQNDKSQELMDDMLRRGVNVKNYHSPVRKNVLDGKSFIVTGTLESMTRDEAHKKIIQSGGTVGSSISSKTNYLIVGEDPGGKLEKARKLGVKILNEKEFLELIK